MKKKNVLLWTSAEDCSDLISFFFRCTWFFPSFLLPAVWAGDSEAEGAPEGVKSPAGGVRAAAPGARAANAEAADGVQV